MTDRHDTAVVVLAAGLGTRFRSDRAKVMHRVAGRTLLRHVLEAIRPLAFGQVVVVVGHQADEVAAEAAMTGLDGLATAIQEEQLGTGHAAVQALGALDAGIRQVVVLPGDTPLLTPATLELMADADGDADAVLLTTELDDPTGYGRVLRDDAGGVAAIVEEADATDAQRALTEVGVSMYRFRRDALADALGKIDAENAQGELYLTDAIEILVDGGSEVRAVLADATDVRGVNDRVELAEVGAVLHRRALEALMHSGVTIVDPSATYVDVGVTVGRDSVILPGCLLEGETTVGEGVTIGPYSRLVDAQVEDGAIVAQSVLLGASVGPEVTVGPFSYLRPGTRLERGAKSGAFVEMKQAVVGEGSKVPHLSYVGDARIGRDVNVGAGTITCNYDGFDKHETEVDDGAFIGSDTMLVAPVRIGRGAVTGAGSTITKDVPDDALAVERSDQRTLEGWARKRRERREAHESGEPSR